MSKGSVNVPDIPDAGEVGYSNTKSKLKAETTQDAIDELSGSVDDLKPILRDSDPTAETVGKLGQHCINTTKGTEWTCVGINGDVYTWTQGGGGSSAVDLVRIKIATPPTKTAYKAGETFDPTGMVVTADYAIGGLVIIEDKPVTGYVYPTAALAAGTASIVISYTEDGETKTVEQAISVTKTSVTIPTYTESRSYNGNVQTPSFTNENSAYMTKSGDVTGQNAGGYAALFDLNDSDLYQWSDGTITQKSVPWSIAKANPSVTAPTAKTLTYNGSDQALVNAGSTDGGTMQYSTDGTTWSGSVPSGHNAGSYAVRYRVAGGTNYNDNAGGTVQVTIAQKATTLTLDKASVTLNADNLTAAVNITTDGDGALSAESSASGVASASISGTVATITHVNRASGTATITIKQAAGTNYKAASKTVSVTADFFSATLNVTAVPGATVTATSGGNSYSGTANSSGIASIAIGQSGTYSVTGSYQDAASNTQSVAVTQDGGTYSTTLSWITLALTAPAGSSVTLTNGAKTFTGTGTGSAVTYYLTATGTWTATAEDGSDSTTETIDVTAYTAYTLKLAFVSIYGVSWDGTSTTAWTRTDDAAGFTDPVPYVAGASNYGSPFDDLAPWKDMTRVTDSEAGEMVKIPKFWYKLTQNGNGMKIQIADAPTEGFSVCPACMDRGDGAGERDYVLIGRYHCASDYKSKTGVKPVANITRSAARSSISNLGSKVWMADWAVRFTLFLLYLVEFADWNTQAKIGKGCGDNSATGNMGYTDSMPYHTGTTQSSRDTFGLGTQYRNIEGLWDNVRDWIDGCYNSGSGLMIILNPANSSDSAGGTSVGTPSNGYPSKFAVKDVSGTFPLFIPTEASGSDSTYSCDDWNFSASDPCVSVGGGYYQSTLFGLFYFYDNSTTNRNAYLGSRSMKLP